MIIFALFAFTILLGTYYGAVTATMVELFPSHLRYTPIAIAHSLTFAVFGGTAPLVNTALLNWTTLTVAPSFYLMFAATVSLLFAMKLTETYRIVLK